MDAKQILNASYLDILYEGKNKKYGGYELRKKYPRRAAIAGLIAVLLVGGLFAAMLIKPKANMDEVVNDVPVVTDMANIEPPPLDRNEPPPPPPPAAPAPVRPTVVFAVPEIKKDKEVLTEEKLTEAPKKNEDVGLKFEKGSDDPNALSRDMSFGTTGGKGLAGNEDNGKGKEKSDEIVAFVEQEAKPTYDWQAYLDKNLKYPRAAMENGTQGKVVLKLGVERNGSISNVKVIRGNDLGNGLPEEAIRVLSAAGRWEPGKMGGNAVRSYRTIPITYKLQ